MEYLKASYYFDFNHERIQQLVSEFKSDTISKKEKAIAVYLKIRDEWKYDPYTISFSEEKYKASFIAQKSTGNCVDKSILVIACLRALRYSIAISSNFSVS